MKLELTIDANKIPFRLHPALPPTTNTNWTLDNTNIS
jgi:hypothetical protein